MRPPPGLRIGTSLGVGRVLGIAIGRFDVGDVVSVEGASWQHGLALHASLAPLASTRSSTSAFFITSTITTKSSLSFSASLRRSACKLARCYSRMSAPSGLPRVRRPWGTPTNGTARWPAPSSTGWGSHKTTSMTLTKLSFSAMRSSAVFSASHLGLGPPGRVDAIEDASQVDASQKRHAGI